MRMRLLFLLFTSWLGVAPLLAQPMYDIYVPKPYGAYDVGVDCKDVPSWVAFSGLVAESSAADMTKAAECSKRTGMKWVLKFGFSNDPMNGAGDVASIRTRTIVTGLLPYIVAVQFNEEWQRQVMEGKWGSPTFDLVDQVTQFGGAQHRLLKDVFGLPVIYTDSFVNSNKVYGLAYYKPLPPFTEVLALETYVPKGSTWDASVKIPIEYTLATTPATMPIVLIAQTFRHPKEWNDQWQDGPKPEYGVEFKKLMEHPRVIAAWLFTWRNRPNGIVGIEGMKNVVGWFR